MMPTVNLKFLIPNDWTSEDSLQDLRDRCLRCHKVTSVAMGLTEVGKYPLHKTRYLARGNYRLWMFSATLSRDRIGVRRFVQLFLVAFAEIIDDVVQGVDYYEELQCLESVLGHMK
ncbi:MAG: hypothetical protein AAFX78_03655 [Cyanobacteria bacterium J06638_20]